MPLRTGMLCVFMLLSMLQQLGLWTWLPLQNRLSAQQRFELSAPNLGVASQAELLGDRLRVAGGDGSVTTYRREPQFDSGDGQWLGFFSPQASQILRWPASHTGNMQIGEIAGRNIRYRTSQMSIRALDGFGPAVNPPGQVTQRPVLPPPNAPAGQIGGLPSNADFETSDLFRQLARGIAAGRLPEARTLQLATMDERGAAWLVSHSGGAQLTLVPAGVPATGDVTWLLAPTVGGLLRIQTYQAGVVLAVAALPGGRLVLQPLSQDATQLWRVRRGPGPHSSFALESVALPGLSLARLPSGIGLQPLQYSPMQSWLPILPPSGGGFQPFYRTVQQEIFPNTPLPPAELELVNTHRNALIVLLGDNRQAAVQQLRIPPGSSQRVTLERDAGATIVETTEVLSRLGSWEQQRLVTQIPASTAYDFSVYEEHLQSIAIDRTGKSPNAIEDVNYMPKSLGLILLTAGPELPERGQLDVYSRAKDANNPGAVRRIDFKQFDDPAPPDRLEQLLHEVQSSTPRRGF